MSGNREYKSDVFSMLMQDKERALQLYNAMNGSSYDNPEDVEMVIHDGGIFHFRSEMMHRLSWMRD